MSRASTLAKAVGANGDISVSGNTTIGDASTDTVTFNAATASIPNGINFANGNFGLGATPSAKLHLLSTGNTTADGVRLTFGTEARAHNIYSALPTGRDLTIAPWRALTINTGSGTTEGVLTLNAYEYTVFGAGSSYTERMRLNASGNLGININSPSCKLDIFPAFSGSTGTTLGGVADANILVRSGGYLNQYGQICFGYTGTNAAAAIGFLPTLASGNTKGDLVFGIRDVTTDTAPTERMRLDSAGNLEIGATTPKNPDGYSATNFKFLTLQATTGGTDRGSILELVGTGGGSPNYWLGRIGFFSTGNSYAHATITSWTDSGGTNSGALIFGTNTSANSGATTERMRISSAGIVTIIGDNGPLRIQGGGYVVSPTTLVLGQYTSTRGYIQVPSSGQLEIWSAATAAVATFYNNGNFNCSGALSKGSGSFRIPHPLPELEATHNLVHSFVEGPQADNLYRGKVTLVDGTATVNIDTVAGMTEGTFVALNREVQCFTTNESDWTAVRGSVAGNILTIEAQDPTCTASISWMVIGERKDKHMYDTDWTDENGKVIVEPLRFIDDERPPFEETQSADEVPE